MEITQSSQKKTPVIGRTTLLAIASCAMAAFLLFHFIMIWVLGRFYIYESNKLILSAETLLILGILVFSSFCFVSALRRSK